MFHPFIITMLKHLSTYEYRRIVNDFRKLENAHGSVNRYTGENSTTNAPAWIFASKHLFVQEYFTNVSLKTFANIFEHLLQMFGG